MTDNQLGDAPNEERYRKIMAELARFLDVSLNPSGSTDLPGLPAGRAQARKTGFVLMVFPFGETFDGRCNYISNGADRQDVVTLMKEMIARFEGQPEVKARQYRVEQYSNSPRFGVRDPDGNWYMDPDKPERRWSTHRRGYAIMKATELNRKVQN